MVKLKIIYVSFSVFLLMGCFYDYGVRSDDKQLVFDSLKNDGNKKFEFTSTLFYDSDYSKPFLIEITHLTKNMDTGKFESIIHIEDWFSKNDKKIMFSTLELRHSIKGKVIEAEKIDFTAITKFNDGTEQTFDTILDEYIINAGENINTISYSKQYEIEESFFGVIDEYIYLELTINGKQHVIEYNLPLRYEKSESLWGLLSFIFSGSM